MSCDCNESKSDSSTCQFSSPYDNACFGWPRISYNIHSSKHRDGDSEAQDSNMEKHYPTARTWCSGSWRLQLTGFPQTEEQHWRMGRMKLLIVPTMKYIEVSEKTTRTVLKITERIACILCMHLGVCRFFTHPTALMHLKSILRKCI